MKLTEAKFRGTRVTETTLSYYGGIYVMNVKYKLVYTIMLCQKNELTQHFKMSLDMAFNRN
jgi:hypothetical protein